MSKGPLNELVWQTTQDMEGQKSRLRRLWPIGAKHMLTDDYVKWVSDKMGNGWIIVRPFDEGSKPTDAVLDAISVIALSEHFCVKGVGHRMMNYDYKRELWDYIDEYALDTNWLSSRGRSAFLTHYIPQKAKRDSKFTPLTRQCSGHFDNVRDAMDLIDVSERKAVHGVGHRYKTPNTDGTHGYSEVYWIDIDWLIERARQDGYQAGEGEQDAPDGDGL